MAQLPTPWEGILLTHFIVSRDVDRSQRFYTEVLGGETVFHGNSSKGRALDCGSGERVDNHQRGWPDGRQANGHARYPVRP